MARRYRIVKAGGGVMIDPSELRFFCIGLRGRWPRRLLAIVSMSAVAAIGARAQASLVLVLDTSELAKRADHIAVADVVSVRSEWDADHRKIHTTIDL